MMETTTINRADASSYQHKNIVSLKEACQNLESNAITHLDLSYFGLKDNDMTELSLSLSRNSSCTSLTLAHNVIGPRGILSLAPSLVSSNVVHLNLEANHIGNEGCRILVASLTGADRQQQEEEQREQQQQQSCLETLNLAYNSISSMGAKHLSGFLSSSSSLETLSLQNNFIGVDGVQSLARSLQHDNRSCRHLFLTGNPGSVHFRGISAMVSMLQDNMLLQELTLDGCSKSPAATTDYQASLVHYYLALNRYGRKCLRSYNLDPPLWAQILAKTGRQPQLLHTVVTGRPDIFCVPA